MAHNNAAEVNVKCEKATTTTLLDLTDFALLQVFSYFNLKDSISFAGTSKRLKSVGALHFTKFKRLDLGKYELYSQPYKPSAETILSHIGQHIETLSINSMRSTEAKAVVDNCVNVTTLKIYDCADTRKLEKWMQQLKLESLTIYRCRDFNKTSVGMAALKELHLAGEDSGLSAMQLRNVLEKTTELETLEVNLGSYRDFNFDIFTKLPKLQCLDIKIRSRDLVNLTEFLKMDGLTRFKLQLTDRNGAERLRRLNSFLEILAERSKLHELKLRTDAVDQNTFDILKSLHDVTSFGFYASDYVNHQWNERWMIHQLVEAQPNLTHLELSQKSLLSERLYLVVKNLVKLKTFKFGMRAEDLEKLDELQINEMLKTSTSRPMLTLFINSETWNAIKIELRFEQRKHRIVQLNLNWADDSYFLTEDC